MVTKFNKKILLKYIYLKNFKPKVVISKKGKGSFKRNKTI